MVSDKEIQTARKKLLKKQKKYLLMNQEKIEERAYWKKRGYPENKIKEGVPEPVAKKRDGTCNI